MTTPATPAAGEAVPTAAFMGKLMEPLPETDLRDPSLARLERRARSEARAAATIAWCGGFHLVRMAEYRHWALEAQRLAHFMGAFPEPPSKLESDAAWNSWGREIDRQFQIPARISSDLTWKKKHLKVALDVLGNKKKMRPEEALIELLECLAGKRARAQEKREQTRREAIARDEAFFAAKRRPKN
ncbi:MAG: hypothetical protein QM699_00610 [Amaricoccus sp.]|uniref:hypothetical protein n=1 Tax=Amaricoccus sp. TaxID=1872485 RepID=UPI0039E621F1